MQRLIRAFKGQHQDAPAPAGAHLQGNHAAALRAAVRTTKLAGFTVILVFFVGFGLWAGTAPLASATIASGTVSPEGSRRTVQHLEGGIIRAIHVKDGDAVDAGDPLVTLEAVAARSTHKTLEARRQRLLAVEARLEAERAGLEQIAFPDELLAEPGEPGLAEVLETQRNLFASRRTALASRQAILSDWVVRLETEIRSLREQVESEERRSGLLREEIAAVRTLVERELAPKPRLLDLARQLAASEGARAARIAEIARAEQAIGGAELEQIAMREAAVTEASDQLDQVRAELIEVGQELEASGDVVRRTVITAPIAGRVVEPRFTTIGGVVGPGEPILDVVPDDTELLIDARISVGDVDGLRPGLTTRVVLSAYGRREVAPLDGVLRHISADRLTDPATRQPYYLTRIAIPTAELAGLRPKVELIPGMPAEVLITTGERTLLDYLVEPLLGTLRRGMRES
ncbi:MAG: HlyD family type I secretion periplasmic adaptor subunit [Geminicoccaceae bacterium]|nr:HlyD family type I secretion periplasmic adaptor subunit [Geminicoccaceae bacterium]